jgi:L-threonylcarbamoyladenylate synthase
MEIIKVNLVNSREVIELAAKSIKEGKILVFPTDTVYGLLANATDEKVAKRVFQIKQRAEDKPLPVFVPDLKIAKEIAFINKKQEEFLRKVWPGKVTVVLKRKNNLAKIISGNQETIGLRIPDYKLVNSLLFKIELSLIGTSANQRKLYFKK